MTDNETTLAELCLALQKIDEHGKALTEQVKGVREELAAANHFLREARVMLVRAAGQMPNNIPLIGEK